MILEDKSLDEFLDSILDQDIHSMDIIAHTGNEIINEFFEKISISDNYRQKFMQTKIRILIRNPEFEVGHRIDYIKNKIKTIIEHQNSGFDKLHFRLYQSLPSFRAVICRGGNSKVINAFLNFYYFPSDEKQSKHYPKAEIIDSKKALDDDLLKIVNTWIEHFWGKTGDGSMIHTIIFDFDGTIADSHDIQITAWIDVIRNANKRPGVTEDNYQQAIRGILQDREKLYVEVSKIYLKAQIADKIYKMIFKDVPDEIKKEIFTERFNIRKQLMPGVNLFPGVKETIHNLAEKHDLVIVSATDEDMIRKYLEQKNISGYFRYVFGRKEPDIKWHGIERKSQLLIKIVSTLGIPVEHLVYVGDMKGDYFASKDIGCDFLEARLFEEELSMSMGIDSMITDYSKETIYFKKWTDLNKQLTKIESVKKRRFNDT